MPINLEQEALTDLLTQTRETTVSALTRLDLERPLDALGRHGYDLLRHLTAWERLICTIIAEHERGPLITQIPLSTDQRNAFNRAALATPLAPEAARQEWEIIRATLREAVNTLTFEAIHRPIHLSGGAMFVSEIIKRVIGHEQHHIRSVCAIQQQTHPYIAHI